MSPLSNKTCLMMLMTVCFSVSTKADWSSFGDYMQSIRQAYKNLPSPSSTTTMKITTVGVTSNPLAINHPYFQNWRNAGPIKIGGQNSDIGEDHIGVNINPGDRAGMMRFVTPTPKVEEECEEEQTTTQDWLSAMFNKRPSFNRNGVDASAGDANSYSGGSNRARMTKADGSVNQGRVGFFPNGNLPAQTTKRTRRRCTPKKNEDRMLPPLTDSKPQYYQGGKTSNSNNPSTEHVGGEDRLVMVDNTGKINMNRGSAPERSGGIDKTNGNNHMDRGGVPGRASGYDRSPIVNNNGKISFFPFRNQVFTGNSDRAGVGIEKEQSADDLLKEMFNSQSRYYLPINQNRVGHLPFVPPTTVTTTSIMNNDEKRVKQNRAGHIPFVPQKTTTTTMSTTEDVLGKGDNLLNFMHQAQPQYFKGFSKDQSSNKNNIFKPSEQIDNRQKTQESSEGQSRHVEEDSTMNTNRWSYIFPVLPQQAIVERKKPETTTQQPNGDTILSAMLTQQHNYSKDKKSPEAVRSNIPFQNDIINDSNYGFVYFRHSKTQKSVQQNNSVDYKNDIEPEMKDKPYDGEVSKLFEPTKQLGQIHSTGSVVNLTTASIIERHNTGLSSQHINIENVTKNVKEKEDGYSTGNDKILEVKRVNSFDARKDFESYKETLQSTTIEDRTPGQALETPLNSITNIVSNEESNGTIEEGYTKNKDSLIGDNKKVVEMHEKKQMNNTLSFGRSDHMMQTETPSFTYSNHVDKENDVDNNDTISVQVDKETYGTRFETKLQDPFALDFKVDSCSSPDLYSPCEFYQKCFAEMHHKCKSKDAYIGDEVSDVCQVALDVALGSKSVELRQYLDSVRQCVDTFVVTAMEVKMCINVTDVLENALLMPCSQGGNCLLQGTQLCDIIEDEEASYDLTTIFLEGPQRSSFERKLLMSVADVAVNHCDGDATMRFIARSTSMVVERGREIFVDFDSTTDNDV